MSATALPPAGIPASAGEQKSTYLNWSYSVKDWLLTIDHKRIAVLYLISTPGMFLLGGVAAAMGRIELTSPHGQLLTSEV